MIPIGNPKIPHTVCEGNKICESLRRLRVPLDLKTKYFFLMMSRKLKKKLLKLCMKKKKKLAMKMLGMGRKSVAEASTAYCVISFHTFLV